ncbi:MAG: TonB-dependent receptor [Gammaproteobacteria bacterium]|nr:TonB-dependent receptor [Gammaproteobacteria bacterium]
MAMPSISTAEKALAVNLDPRRYGSFAEIGAGQEVVRWFFRSGGAAGTIAKSISAYDMQVSDAIYGSCERYVCYNRLQDMLACEQALNRKRLTEKRGEDSTFFAFADTVSARNFHGTNECHGWLGILFQTYPGGPDNRIIIHVRMLDQENAQQQEALGIVGVNLVHGAFAHYDDADRLLDALLDNLSTDRIEIDLIELTGPKFAFVDSRVMALKLVQKGLSGAALFSAEGRVLQPSEALRKKPLLVERGHFRPFTHANMDMMQSALAAFEAENGVPSSEVLPVMEMTMHDLGCDGEISLEDFINRAEVLAATGFTVLISEFREYYRLANFLFRYTQRPIGIVMPLENLRGLFDEASFVQLEGGILESFGKMFRNDLQVLAYPDKRADATIEGAADLQFDPMLERLYDFLMHRRSIVPLTDFTPEYLDIRDAEVVTQIVAGDAAWADKVPARVAQVIREKGLFGYTQDNAGENARAG